MTRTRGWFALLLLLAACGDDAVVTDASVLCTSDDQCDDGVFCNGAEVCSPGTAGTNAFGCGGADAPCLAGQLCREDEDRCAALCDVTEDADGDGVKAIECGGDDCDDSDASRFPGNFEICDEEGVDEDCDPTTFGDVDVDMDGYIDARCCNGDDCGTDCADRMATVNPGAAEVCDLVDQDCDGDVDEGVQTAGFEDRDGDRYGDPERARMACAFDADVSPSMNDCDDGNPRRHGQMLEICDEVDNDCDGMVDEDRYSVSWYADTDGDGFGDPGGEVRSSCEPIEGFSTLPFDCDDSDPTRSPITPERCNALDDDCDGRADFQLADGDTEDDDGDGVADARCPGGMGMDCDDRDPLAKPGLPELCDGVDNDCDGIVDEGATEQLWYVDDDGDGFGDDAAERRGSCERVPGLVLIGGDCDDGDSAVRPSARERCNGVDDDCDGTVDENAGFIATYLDEDGDGFGTGMPLAQCAVPGLRALTPGDCDDSDPANRPGAPELCDDVDNDCDSITDEGASVVTWYADTDGDGFGDAAGDTQSSCEPVAGYSVVATDCDDGDSSRFPGAPELCDTVDQDCDSVVDEMSAEGVLQYPDSDGDGFGGGIGVTSCAPLPGHALRRSDCDDADATRFPGADERCNAVDDDCDGNTDEAPAGYLDCEPDSTNATPVCTVGVCGYGACLPGYADCDGVVANGCESDLATDPRHCGGCDQSCGPGGSCTGSTCDRVPVTSVATTAGVGCAVRSGQVFCWGDERRTGTVGGRGDGELQAGILRAPSPDHPAVGLTDAVAVVSGDFHFCALRATGEAVCWGSGGSGQLGDGAGTTRFVPVPVQGGHIFEQIAASTSQTCGRTAAGDLLCWGNATNRSALLTPTPMLRADGGSADAIDLAVGRDHVCVVDSTRRVYCLGWTATAVGQSGGIDFDDLVGPIVDGSDMPLENVSTIEAGGDTTCAVVDGGQVWCWGSNASGQLGDGTYGNRPNAAPVMGVSDATDLFLGRGISCAIRTTGAVLCWGRNSSMVLGDPAFTESSSPLPRGVPGLAAVTEGSGFVRTNSGFLSAICAAAADGVACWGPGSDGRSGDGTTDTSNRAPPVRVLGFP